MIKKIVAIAVVFTIGMIILIVGLGSNNDKNTLLDWIHSINKDNTEISFWKMTSEQQMLPAKMLSEDEIQSLTAILADVSKEELVQDKEPSKSTSLGYGLILIEKDKQYDAQQLIQAVAPDGEFEIYYNNKYWFVKNEKLSDFINDFLENK